MKKEVLTFIRIICFNLVETYIIFLLGKIFNVPIGTRIMLMVTFFFIRMIVGKPKHYNKAYRCALWSSLVFISLYALTKLELPVTILLTIFTAFISTGRADIKDTFMWNKESKYEALRNLLSVCPNNSIILEHEEYWRKNYPMRYKIFQYFFRENMTHKEIIETLGLPDNNMIKRECETIYSILEKPLDLPPVE